MDSRSSSFGGSPHTSMKTRRRSWDLLADGDGSRLFSISLRVTKRSTGLISQPGKIGAVSSGGTNGRIAHDNGGVSSVLTLLAGKKPKESNRAIKGHMDRPNFICWMWESIIHGGKKDKNRRLVRKGGIWGTKVCVTLSLSRNQRQPLTFAIDSLSFHIGSLLMWK